MIRPCTSPESPIKADVNRLSGRTPGPEHVKTRLGSLVTIILYFPYVGFLENFDIQPIFFGAAMAGLLARLGSQRTVAIRLSSVLLALLFILLPAARFLLQSLSDAVTSASVLSFAVTSFHILVIITCSALIRTRIFVDSPRILWWVIAVHLGVGVIQFFVPGFLSFLVYRGFQELAETGRGVRSLTSEPAVFGYTLSLLNVYVVYMLTFRYRASARCVLLMSLGLLAANLVLAASFYSVFWHFIILLALVFFLDKRLFVLASLGCFASFNLLPMAYQYFDNRFFYIMEIALNDPLLLYEQGAFLRVLNVPISLYGGFFHGPFGSGFAPPYTVSGGIRIFENAPFYFDVGDRNAGGIVEFYLRLGLLALPILWWYFCSLLKISRLSWPIGRGQFPIGRWAAISIFILSFLYNSMANPLIWLIFFLFLQKAQDPAATA